MVECVPDKFPLPALLILLLLPGLPAAVGLYIRPYVEEPSQSFSEGTDTYVTQEILEAKAVIDRAGIGCEPASAAALAGARQLKQSGVIGLQELVVAILTGHILKDAETTFNYHMGTGEERPQHANRPVVVDAQFDEVRRVLESYL